ncbi:MAG: hypothetical protein WCW27_00205 [Patescibacteria group bacterium]|jgi:nucleotidyltransferase/DNA polymerase involved in DNA repair
MAVSNHSNVPIEFMPNIGQRTAKVLRSLGVFTIGQFKQLPEQLLIELFGPSIKTTLVNTFAVVQPPVPVVAAYKKPTFSFLKKLQLATQFVSML